jgi:hypothetical protein
MRAKALLIVSVVVVAVLFTLSLSWARGGNAQRQRKQFHRIVGGAKSGEVTHRELKSLGREQRRIRHTIRKARADGRFNARERHRIHTLQNRASKHIYLAKHNREKRHGWRPHYRHKHYWHKPRHRHYPSHYWHNPRYHHYPLHYGHKPAYYGYHFAGGYADPYYSFNWSIGWW